MKTEVPLVSLVVFSYNFERYIYDSVMSALNQDYDNLEILITDDCSTDNSFGIIDECVRKYGGPHKLIINRNQKNVGLAANINLAWEMTHGDLIVAQGGDDISLPNRVRELVAQWVSTNPRPDLVYSNVHVMNSEGRIVETQTGPCNVPTLDEVTRGRWFIAGGMAASYSRHLAGKSWPLDTRIVFEDFVLTFRAQVGNGIAHVAAPLVKYRKHNTSIMANVNWEEKNRSAAQRRARHLPAEFSDRLNTWEKSGRFAPGFTWRLRRELARVKLDAMSCRASRIRALACSVWALISLRPRTARTLFVRDVVRR